jgi:hypothetical protein
MQKMKQSVKKKTSMITGLNQALFAKMLGYGVQEKTLLFSESSRSKSLICQGKGRGYLTFQATPER